MPRHVPSRPVPRGLATVRAAAAGVVAAALAAAPPPGAAWGPIGHRMVAETAALLLLERGSPWGPLLARHRFELGVAACLPDAHSRQNDGRGGKLEGPTHFFFLDRLLGTTRFDPGCAAEVAAVPCVHAEARRRLGTERLESLGSAPWRIEQLRRRARAELAGVRRPAGGYLEGARDEGEPGRIFRAFHELGLMSHYSGDATMPYHAISDWNAWDTGQGGLHFYFEFDCVNALEPGLSQDVLAAARRDGAAWLEAWLGDGAAGGADSPPPPAGAGDAPGPASAAPATPVAVVARAFLDSALAIPRVAEVDRREAWLAPSDAASGRFAKRRPAAEACPAFRPLLVERLAKGAVLTAWLWETALPRDADLGAAGSLQFSDFVTCPGYVPPAYDWPDCDDGR